MAFVMALPSRFDLLDKILNVSFEVSAKKTAPNKPDDVTAVQKLCALGAKNHRFGPPNVTGVIDPLTCFYIFNMQASHHNHRQSTEVVDGIVSKAKAARYPGGVYTIVILNNIAKAQNPAGWEKLLSQYSVGKP